MCAGYYYTNTGQFSTKDPHWNTNIIDEFVINKNYWERGFTEISETKDIPITKPLIDNSVDNTY